MTAFIRFLRTLVGRAPFVVVCYPLSPDNYRIFGLCQNEKDARKLGGQLLQQYPDDKIVIYNLEQMDV